MAKERDRNAQWRGGEKDGRWEVYVVEAVAEKMGGMMSLPKVMRGGSAGCLSNGGSTQ